MMQGPVLIVGAGHAGFQVAASLRQLGFKDRVAVINDEGHCRISGHLCRRPISRALAARTA